MTPIRILLADDHANVRSSVRIRLSREPYFEIVGEASSSQEAVQRALELRPDIVLIDPIMRDGHGLLTVDELAVQLPQTSVVVLTAVADTTIQMELRKRGVGYILDKGLDSERLIRTLREIGRMDCKEQMLEEEYLDDCRS